MSFHIQPDHVNRDEGKALWFLDSLMFVKASSQSTGGAYSLVEQVAPPGSATPLHINHGEDEAFYVLEGEITFRCGEEVLHARTGSYIMIPKDTPHSYTIMGSGPARLLILATPGGLEGFFEELSEPARELKLPTGTADMQAMMPRLMAAAAKYRVELLGPPPGDR